MGAVAYIPKWVIVTLIRVTNSVFGRNRFTGSSLTRARARTAALSRARAQEAAALGDVRSGQSQLTDIRVDP